MIAFNEQYDPQLTTLPPFQWDEGPADFAEDLNQGLEHMRRQDERTWVWG